MRGPHHVTTTCVTLKLVLPRHDQVFDQEASAGTWLGLGLSPALAQQLAASNFERPTRVQQQSIPLLLAGRWALSFFLKISESGRRSTGIVWP